MDDTNKELTYTNRLSGKGEYVPATKDYWTDYPAEEGMPERPAGEIGERMTPDYSRRDEFENHVFKEIGANPFSLNPMDVLKETDKMLPELFEHVFNGKVSWVDRSRLSKNQAAHWENVVKKLRADSLDKATSFRNQKVQEYTFMMGQFDVARKEYESSLDRYRDKKKIEAAIIAKRKVGLTREDVTAISAMDRTLEKQFAEEGDVSNQLLRQRNRAARIVGLPTIQREEIQNDKGVPWWKRWVGKALELIPGDTGEETGKKMQSGTTVTLKEEGSSPKKAAEKKVEKKIVETRITKDGRKLVKYDDGTIEELK